MDVALGLLIMAWIYIFVYDCPVECKSDMDKSRKTLSHLSLLSQLKHSYFNIKNWIYGLYTSLLNLPFWILGAAWGIPFLTQVYHFDTTEAASITSIAKGLIPRSLLRKKTKRITTRRGNFPKYLVACCEDR
ncbi:hypothetical protein PsalMR5_04613 (plasmid) [Piscirickettsia salmonis]|nr:hypothetical protein PsalSR1_04631 [Piscirickettsia salmonis]QGP61916.1 hypothetical protein PsalBI1_04558 [Piscirickettsia salmonis]QGP66688.1 hypothetical protein PsalMR5_04613 [Piscirickettsia salmonis]